MSDDPGWSRAFKAATVVASFIAGSAWMYVIGLAFAAVDFALIAPTSASVDRRERELRASGSGVSLRAALDPPASGHAPS